jgi:hypothetical protein
MLNPHMHGKDSAVVCCSATHELSQRSRDHYIIVVVIRLTLFISLEEQLC